MFVLKRKFCSPRLDLLHPPYFKLKVELFTENGAVQIGAKHKMAQSDWGARGLRFSGLKV